jgi:hypothetical protein
MHDLIAVLVLAAATSYKPSVSLTAAVNPQLVQRRNAIAADLTPSARQKLHTIALSVASSPSITDGTTRAAITSAFGNLDGVDVEALAFIVLTDAAQSAEQDLKTVMDQIKDVNKQKDALRQELSKSNSLKPNIRKAQAHTLPTAFTVPPPLPPNATVAQKQHRLDDLNDLGDLMQIKIQTEMSQMQSAQHMASNIMKSLNDSRTSVLKNLK